MRCRSCNDELTDEEAVKKYDNYIEIKNPEDRYIELCAKCLRDSDLSHHVDDDYAELIVEDHDEFDEFFHHV